jgi:hypothetical protein
MWRWGRWSFPFVESGGLLALIINIMLAVIYIGLCIFAILVAAMAVAVLAFMILPFYLIWIIIF